LKPSLYNIIPTSKIIIAFIAVILLSHTASAQAFQFVTRKISGENKFLTSELKHFLKDRNGFLWIQTENKVERFDGKYVKSFPITEGNKTFRGIAEDENGKIWMATTKNIYFFENEKNGFKLFADTSHKWGSYLGLKATESNAVYILCRSGLLYPDSKENKIKKAPVNHIVINNSSYFPFTVYGDYLFFSNRQTIYRYNTKQSTIDSVAFPLCRLLIVFSKDSLWAGNTDLNSSLVCFKTKKAQPVTAAQFTGSFIYKDIYVTGSFPISSRYVFTSIRYKGFFVYDKLNNTFIKTKVFAGSSELTTGIAFKTSGVSDMDEETWLHTEDAFYSIVPQEKGIGFFQPSVATGNIEASDEIRNFAEDATGNIWMATNNGFVKWNRQTNNTQIYLPKTGADNHLNFASVRGIAVNGNKIIVGQSVGGIWIFDPLSETYRRPPLSQAPYKDSIAKWMTTEFLSGIHVLNNGNFITATNWHTYLLNKEDNSIKAIQFKGGKKLLLNRIVYQDTKNRLWISNAVGIHVADSNYHIISSVIDSALNANIFYSFVQVTDSTFWVAYEGIYEVTLKKNNSLTLLPVMNGLEKVRFFNLVKDEKGFLWASSDKGIYRLAANSTSFHLFDYSDNVLNNQYANAIPFTAKDGTVYFPGFNGVTFFNPQTAAIKEEQLHTIITSVKINDDDSLFFSRVNNPLRYNQNSIEINYIAPHILNGSKVMYRYLMEGVDNGWVSMENNTFVRFSSLQNGQYKFRVAASLNGKDWFETSTPFVFTIQPPFWKTWWFSLLSLIIIVAVIWTLLKWRINQIKRKAALHQQMTELETKALRAQMNPHFIFNAMNSIQHFIFNKDVDNANYYLSQFSTLMRMVLQHSKVPTISLSDEVSILNLYLEIEKLRMGKSFSYSITIDLTIEEPDAVRLPSMVVQPFAENALKHGLLTKTGEKKLSISFTMPQNNQLLCTVTDNGIGRDKAMAESTAQLVQIPHASDGIQLVKNRLKLQNAAAAETIFITDLKSEEGSPVGTKVEIYIPIQ
jgi:ligand-binding sensor domain-containing protein